MTFNNEYWFQDTEFYNGVGTQSLKFNSGQLTLTQNTTDPSDSTKGTLAFWVKRGNVSQQVHSTNPQYLVTTGSGSTNSGWFALGFGANSSNNQIDRLFLARYDDAPIGTNTGNLYRDPSAWMHIAIVWNTTSSTTSNNKAKLYINGVRDTADTYTNIAQNDSFPITNRNQEMTIGFSNFSSSASNHYYGYMADVNVLDGIDVGETNSILDEFIEIKEGVCIPKSYSGSYGNNGFRLEFKNTSVGTGSASTIGADTKPSGTLHHFTSQYINDYDCNLQDSPENNFATLNTIDPFSGTVSEGNLKFANGYSFRASASGFAIPQSGKWYFEVLNTTTTDGDNAIWAGVALQSTNISGQPNNGSTAGFYGLYNDSSLGILNNGSQSSYSTNSISANSIIQVAVDVDNEKLYVGIDNSYYSNSSTTNGDPSGGNNPSQSSINLAGYKPFVGAFQNTAVLNTGTNPSFVGAITAGTQTDANGRGLFKYAPPTNFLALCSRNINLDDLAISPQLSTQSDDHFNTSAYDGTGSSLSITGVGFKPDWVWIKKRSGGSNRNHILTDSNRGVTQCIATSILDGQFTNSGGLTSFDTDGFSVGTYDSVNESGSSDKYIAWNWLANGTSPQKTYKVVVVDDGGNNRYRFRNSADSATFAQTAVTLNLQEGGVYTFNMDDSSNASHPFSIGTSANSSVYTSGIVYELDGVEKTYSQYTSGFSSASTRRLTFTVPASAPVLYYWCSVHSGMGGQINTNTTHGSTNFDGNILTVANPNTTSGFSIVTYTGQNAATTVGHGLGKKPQMVIVKNLSDDGSDWIIGHHELATSAFANNKFLKFATNGEFSNSAVFGAEPTTTAIQLTTTTAGNLSAASKDYVMYAFTSIEGFCKVGSFTGNSSVDGPFIYTGFRPRFIIAKSSGTGSWHLVDQELDPNPVGYLNADTSDPYQDYNHYDILSNGFKIRDNGSHTNPSQIVIYVAFAEVPFKFANAR